MTQPPNITPEQGEWTKGPWSVAKGCDQFVCNDGKWIASTMGIRGEEGAANARLIAASPDLYAALREFVTVYDGFQDGDGNPCPTLEKARRALSKATSK